MTKKKKKLRIVKKPNYSPLVCKITKIPFKGILTDKLHVIEPHSFHMTWIICEKSKEKGLLFM